MGNADADATAYKKNGIKREKGLYLFIYLNWEKVFLGLVGVGVGIGIGIGIGIYPIEYGKSQVLDSLSDYTDISYFGDKYTPEGNDYELISHPKIKGYPVDSISDTLEYIK